MGRGLNMSQVKEIWGNGTNVIIKFTRDVGGTWWAASEWMSVSYPYTEQFLKANGYRRLKWQD
jgi:asparagine N-glycosylation enzyme membrane subunit Stt3